MLNTFLKSFLLALAIACTIIFITKTHAADVITFTAQDWVTYVGIRPWDSTFKITGKYWSQGNYQSVNWSISFFKYEDRSVDTFTTQAQSLVCKINTNIQKDLQAKIDVFNVLIKAERCPEDPQKIISMAQEIASLTNQLYSYQKEVTLSTTQTPKITIKEWQIINIQTSKTIVKEVFRTILPSTWAR